MTTGKRISHHCRIFPWSKVINPNSICMLLAVTLSDSLIAAASTSDGTVLFIRHYLRVVPQR